MNSLPSGQKVLLFLVLLVILSSIMILKTDFIRFNVPYSSVLLDRNNALLAARIASDGQWRFPPQKNVPVKFRQALILFEDKRFNYHLGIDPIAIVRAAIANFKTQKIVSGASTLNMQIARLSRPGKSRTIFQKLIEILLALHLEVRMNKDEIIALYASHAPFGGNVVGLEAASWRYFGRDAMQLSWAEAAMLAVLPNNPALIHQDEVVKH
jgi:penicillin-binding protein 1C